MTASQLGESFDPLGAHLRDPHAFYARARAEEPVFYSPRLRAQVVTRYEDVRAIVRDTASFSSANAIRGITPPSMEALAELQQGAYLPDTPVIGADGDAHDWVREPFARHFSPARVKATVPFMRERAEALLEALDGDTQVELMSRFARPLPLAVITRLFGLDDDDQAVVDAGTRGLLLLEGTPAPVEDQAQAARDLRGLHQLLARHVHDRRAAPREDDLISAVLAALAPGTGPLTPEQDNEVIGNLAGVLLAGHTTTAPQIGSGIRHLLTHRDQWELLCAKPDLLPRAVEEICRYDASSPGMFRLATAEVTVGGRAFPAGTEFYLLFASANRDESVFPDADRFDITRPPPNRHLTFGHGIHGCLGAGLARTELTVALETLTQRRPGIRLVPDQDVPIDPVFVSRGPTTLRVLL